MKVGLCDQTHWGDGFPVADVVPNEGGDVVESFSLQPELDSGVGFIQRHHLRDSFALICHLLVFAATLWPKPLLSWGVFCMNFNVS